jgi:3alpha(or 20beta)-hydroxysteroid dehydrogenase
MTEGIREDFLQIPLGRGADAIEVSMCVLYLSSDESSYTTGTELVVDGGWSVGLPHKTF